MWVEERYIPDLFGRLEWGDNLQYPRIDRMIILKWILKSGMKDMDWIGLVEDRVRWRALVNAVINLPVP